MRGNKQTKMWSRDWRKGHQEVARLGDPFHIQSPYTIVDAKKCFLIGARYSCFLRPSGSAWQIQKWMLTSIHWTEHRVPSRGSRESTQGAEGVWHPIGWTSVWTNQYLQSSEGLNHQPKSTHGETHDSSCICSRGWPCQTSMGGEVLGPVKALCPSVGECQGQEAGILPGLYFVDWGAGGEGRG